MSVLVLISSLIFSAFSAEKYSSNISISLFYFMHLSEVRVKSLAAEAKPKVGSLLSFLL